VAQRFKRARELAARAGLVTLPITFSLILGGRGSSRGRSPDPHMSARPRWKRVAGRARDALYRGVTLIDSIARRRDDDPLPPAHLRIYYYRTSNPTAFARACEGARAELVSQGLRPEHRILDIGSGIGNLALGLVDYLHGGYEAIEIHREAVTWCQKAISPRHPAFQFHHADVANDAYNPGGRLAASEYQFPFDNRDFDLVFLGSVFTHMLPSAVEHYMGEISRVLRPGGICIASYFLLNDDSGPAVDAGRSFMSFRVKEPSGLCRLHDPTNPEAAVALDESFVRRLYDDAGLRIQDVRRGRWWSGQSDDQDVVKAIRETAPATYCLCGADGVG
jgi:SAM-dependent methyltransferase